MAIEVSAQNPRSVKALMIFAACETWQTGKTKDGRSFFAIPSCSEPGLFHMVDARECSCRDFVRRGGPCKHVLAVKLWLAAFQTGAVSPKRETATPEGDLIILTPEGAAFLAEQRPNYADLFPPCRIVGCPDLADALDGMCDKHASDLEFFARTAHQDGRS